jgi:hypothetical protein
MKRSPLGDKTGIKLLRFKYKGIWVDCQKEYAELLENFGIAAAAIRAIIQVTDEQFEKERD